MTKYNVLKDVSTVTTIPYTQLLSVIDTEITCIAHDVKECLPDNVSVLNIGIGYIAIMVDNNEIKYKFVPSKTLDNKIKESICCCDDLPTKLENLVEKKMLEAYKDFL